MSLIDASIGRARPVLASLFLILLAGSMTFVTIPKEAEPDVTVPWIIVSLLHRGISPEDAERLLIRPMEKELRAVEGVLETRATAYQGGASLQLKFDTSFNVDKALSDVRNKVTIAKAKLPDDTEEPLVQEINLSLFPVVVVALSSDMPERSLLRLAKALRDKVETIPEVLSVDIAGDRAEQVEIIIDPASIEAYGISAGEIMSFIARSNKVVGAGALDTGQGRFAIKVPGLIDDFTELMEIPVRTRGDSVVKVRDIAQVRRTFKDPEGFARVNGKTAIALEVSKRLGTNIIDTVAKVRAVVEEEKAFWPEGVQITYMQDRSADIQLRLDDLRNNVATAVLLVMIVTVASIGLRSGLLVGVSVPGSFLLGVLVLGAAGLTMNMVVLFGLIMAVGMVVDGATVVVEYADRKMAEGLPSREAYALASTRMVWPVVSSTLTVLAAFLPLAFWTGLVGEFMKYLPITLVATLAASLLMALVFVPTLGAYFGKVEETDPALMKALAAQTHAEVTQLSGMTGWYARCLRDALHRPALVLVGAGLVLLASWGSYIAFGKGVEFFPDIEPDRVIVKVSARGNLSVHEQDGFLREVEDRILGLEGVKAVYSRSGPSKRTQEKPEDQIGALQMEFLPWGKRPSAAHIIAQIRERTADLAGLRIQVEKEENGPPVGKDVQLELASRDPALLIPAATLVREGFETVGGFIDAEDSRPLPGIQWEMEVDRAQASKFGADVTAVGEVVQLVTTGLKFSSYRPIDADEEVDIVARFPVEYRSLDQLDRLRITLPDVGSAPLGGFVTRVARPKVSEIHRVDGLRVMTAQADVQAGLLPDNQVQKLRAWLKTSGIDPRVQIKFKGQDEEQAKSEAFLGKAFGMALFLVAVILLIQFNSFYSTALILSAVVMSTVGVMLGLLATGQPFGIIMNGIGVISLAGIVVSNNIILIDTYDRLIHEYADPLDAILHTCVQRLRPILLTTGTTILGLLPMMYTVNIDFITREVSVGAPSMQWWTQLSTALVWGLSFSTVLTLVVTPCALLVKQRVLARLRARRA
ncbi:MAG: acriflavin resistance protein [Alphaproteobacteria bacterium RIFOXYD12_FULL_60_8]|nr:MAG: acriflavin resistance protein [Alphaproteobacteria bacterium RIFOXYD12_FULL_60_8]